VPRAKRFSRFHVEQRWNELQVDPVLIETLVQKAAVADQAQKERFEYKLNWTIRAYRARVLADKQERPAQIVAALKPGLKPATSLLGWLNLLPQNVRLDLRAGGMESLLRDLASVTEALMSRTKNRVAYWQGHVEAHRPAGEGSASLDLRRSLTEIIATHSPDAPAATDRQKRANERKRRSWVAFAANKIGARYPHEKTHRRRFTGEHSSSSKELKDAKRRGVEKHRRVRQSRTERRLKGVLI
jgi:hypothetical protein